MSTGASPVLRWLAGVCALTLLAWFAYEWVQFQVRSNAAVSHLRAKRLVMQGGREVPMVWAGLPFDVRIAVENAGFAGLPFAVVEDRPAVATERVAHECLISNERGDVDGIARAACA